MAGNARKDIESRTGKPVITSKNAVQLNALVTDMIEGVIEGVVDTPSEEPPDTLDFIDSVQADWGD